MFHKITVHLRYAREYNDKRMDVFTLCYFYTSMKSYKEYIFTSPRGARARACVCVCLCVSVCLSVCLSVCKLNADRTAIRILTWSLLEALAHIEIGEC